MKRGELWIARAELYASKARPVLIIQADEVTEYGSIIACLVTSHKQIKDTLRLEIQPTEDNGLEMTSYLMFDKIFSFDKADLAQKIGELSVSTMAEVDKRLKLILGLA